jgi:NADPH:quinone reductase-like Zn-dependent oxidoreductase
MSLEKRAVPVLGDNEVLVEMHAASLNYRDLVLVNVSDDSVANIKQQR